MRRQKSIRTTLGNDRPKATKSLGTRYAELLKLREVVERTQSEQVGPAAELLAQIDQPVSKDDRSPPYH